MRRFLSIALMVCLLYPLGCSPRPTEAPATPGAPVVRVRLHEAETSVTLRVTQSPAVHVGPNPIGSPFLSPNARLTLDQGGWRVDGRAIGHGELIIQPAALNSVTVNGAGYRGFLRFVPVGGGRFDVVNEVQIDDYLKGVVAKEMLPDWHPEAYKAQAIVARTYAVFEARTAPRNRHWDLLPDQRSQVYGGIPAETDKAVYAVDETVGQMLVYGPPGQEKIFKAYFSSCCGGIGQNPSDAFGEPFHPACIEQNVGTLCKASPRFNWGPITVSKIELTRRVKAWGKRNGRAEERLTRIVRIDKSARNSQGRPVRYVIHDAGGAKYALTGEELRWAVNTDAPRDAILWSSWIEPADAPNDIRFTGRGFGHGVGMCQWCTQTRALLGLKGEQIVLLAYPGAKLETAY